MRVALAEVAPGRGSGVVVPFDRLRFDPAARAVIDRVAEARGVDRVQLLGHERARAAVSLARQLAMYLMHVELGRPYGEVGRLFGRDRTTVSHACAVIEDMREAADFDRAVDAIKAAIRAGAAGAVQ